MLVIVGIDPGTTVGLAVLDLRGSLIATESFRNKSTEEIIQKIYSFGRPLAVGSDKLKTPRQISEICAKIGSKAVPSKEDLTIREKEQVSEIYELSALNSHERDALAGAFSAYKELRGTVEKIRTKTEDEEFESILYEAIVKEKSLTGILKRKSLINEESDDAPLRKTEKKNPLSLRIDELKEENRNLKKALLESSDKVIELKNLLKETKTGIRSITEKMLDKKARIIAAESERQQQAIEELKRCLKDLKLKHHKLIELISSGKSVILPRFKSLGLEGRRIGEEIEKNSMIFVDEPAESAEILEMLARKSIKAFTYSKKAKKHFCLDRILFEDKRIVITDKAAIKRAVESKSEVDITQILDEYKKTR
ncbi:MAG TPA: DUF460 domain-containing protein [Candidatus Woesearchaeota archaeon]|nr:DUF460 domain-containing protein [Candidatus Woesearchaeota archaeon]